MRRAQVEQAEAVAAEDFVGGTHAQRVVARRQLEDAGAVVGVAVAERLVRNHGAARSGQVPAQVVAVAAVDVHGLRVEVDQFGLAQAERVVIALPLRGDRTRHHGVERQRRRVVADRLHIDRVGRRCRLVVASLDQQRVAARQVQLRHVHVAVVHVVRAPDRGAVRIEQLPVGVVAAAEGDAVEVETLAGYHVEPVDIGLGGRVQRLVDQRRAGDDLRPDRQIEQTEGIAARRFASTVDRHRIVARSQVHDRAPVGRVGVAEIAPRHDGAQRARERPVEAGVVGQHVEIDALGLGQREGMGVALSLHVQAGVDRLTQLHGRALVGHLEHIDAVGAGAGLVVAPLDQQRVHAVVGQRDRAHIVVVHVIRPPHGTAERIQQPPVRVVARIETDPVEVVALARAGAELVDVGFVRGVQRLVQQRGPRRDLGGHRQVQHAELVLARAALYRQHVVPRHEFHDRGAIGGVAVAERASRYQRAARAAQAPVQRGVVRQHIKIRARRLRQIEVETVHLAAGAERSGDGVSEHERRQHLGTSGDDGHRNVVQVIVRAPTSIARAKRHAPVVGREARDEVVLHHGHGRAAVGREPDRDLAAARHGLDHDLRVVEQPAVQAEARGHQRVQVELGKFAAVEVQRYMVVADLAVVHGVEADAKAARQVHLLSELRRRPAVAKDVRIEPRKADAVTLIADPGDAQVEVDRDAGRDHARRRVGNTDGVVTRDRARQQAQEVAAGSAADHGRRGRAEGRRAVGKARDVEILRAVCAAVGQVQVFHLEAVIDGRALVVAAFDEQVVGSGVGQRHVDRVGKVARAEHQSGVRVHEAPGRTVSALADHRAADLIARAGVEAVHVGLAARVQAGADGGPQRQGARRRQVDQVELVVARGVRAAVYGQGVVAGHQFQHRGAAKLVGIAGREAAPGHDVAARPAEGPVEARVVRPGVEIQGLGAGQAEGVAVALADVGDAGADGCAQGQGRSLVLHRLHLEAVAGVAAVVEAALDQQRVLPGQRQHDLGVLAGVVELCRPEHRASVGVEQAPVGVAVGAAQRVKVVALAGRGDVEAVGRRRVGRRQHAADQGPGRDRAGLRQVQQAERERRHDVVHGVHTQRVVARQQVEEGRVVDRVAIGEAATAHDHAARSAQCPVQVAVARDGVEIEPRGRIGQREGVVAALARLVNAAAHDDAALGLQRGVVVPRCGVAQRGAAAFVRLEVGDEPGFVAVERLVLRRQDVGRAARDVPDPDLVHRARKRRDVAAQVAAAAEHQRRVEGHGGAGGRRSRSGQHAVDVDAQLSRGAVDGAGDMGPGAGDHDTGCRVGVVVVANAVAVTGAEVHGPVGVEPHRVGPARRVTAEVALVEDRAPGVAEVVRVDPGLDRQVASEVKRRVAGHRQCLQAVEDDSAAQRSRFPGWVHAIRQARDDGRGLVQHALHAEAIVGAAGSSVAPAFDQQRVASAVGQGAHVRHLAAHVVRAPVGPAPGVEQAPIGVAAVRAVEVDVLAGDRVKLVRDRGVGRAQRAVDLRVQRQRRRSGEVHQAERIAAR